MGVREVSRTIQVGHEEPDPSSEEGAGAFLRFDEEFAQLCTRNGKSLFGVQLKHGGLRFNRSG